MAKQLCIVCGKNKALKNPQYGWLPCESCGSGKKRVLPYEFTTQAIRESRKKYWKDTLQSSRDGVLSKERLDAYGTRGLKVTKEQIDNAQYVWNQSDSKPYKEGNPRLI